VKINTRMSSPPVTPGILIVDDDEMIRYILKEVLSGAGYAVVEAENGEAALQKLSEHPLPLVLMDRFMPGMSGPEALQRIREQWPATRLVLLSGAPEGMEGELRLEQVRTFPKPFDNQELLRMVREELQACGLHP
jgi:CheY-like chemotaxis protein